MGENISVEVGDAVAMDEVVGEIETDKTALPIVSPASGVIEEIFIEDGGKVMKGDQLFKLKLGDAPPSSAPESKEAPPPPPPPPPAQASESIPGNLILYHNYPVIQSGSSIHILKFDTTFCKCNYYYRRVSSSMSLHHMHSPSKCET